MSTPLLRALVAAAFACVLSSTLAQQPSDDEVSAVVARYKEAVSRQDADEAKAEGPSKAAYIRDLEKIRDDCKSRGQLTGQIEAEAVLKAVMEGAEPPSGKVLKSALGQARTNYERARDSSLRLLTVARTRLQTDYDRSILDLEQKYTRAGNLKAALEAREARRPLLTIESHVDGPSTLCVRKDGLYWINGGNAKPDTTYVNGKKWMPRWGKPDQERGTDKTDLLSITLPTLELKAEVVAISREKGGEGMERRTPIDVKQYGSEIQIAVPDPEPGARWYRLVFRQK